MENQSNSQDQAPEMSEAEMAAMRKKITSQYKEEIIFLKTQSEYEDLMATIEESKFRRYEAMAKSSHLFAQMEAQGQENEAAKEDFNNAKKAAEQNITPSSSDNSTVKKRTLVKKD